MKNKFKYILMTAGVCGAMNLASCSSDFMDVKPHDQYDQEAVFQDAGLTQSLINSIYYYAKDGAREHTTTGLTDDAYFTHNYGQIAVNESTVSGGNLQWYSQSNCPFRWDHAFTGIYYANLVLANIKDVPDNGSASPSVMEGETRFLRAYIYSNLLRGFGGVPIVSDVFGLDDAEAVKVPRNSVGEVLNFIIEDCEKAFSLLPASMEAGRANKWAAKALEARMYLHVASELYADRTINTLKCNQYDGDRSQLYQKALAAAKEVINSGNYELLDCRAGSVEEVAELYHQIAISNNSETIWARQFDLTRVTNWIGLQHGPNGYHNWSGTTPTNDFVMSFEMADGSISDAMTHVGERMDSNPYLGREPRFYADLGFDGSIWGRKRAADGYALDPTPLGNLQCGVYELSSGGKAVEATYYPDATGNPVKLWSGNGTYGCDTRKGPIEDWNGSFTSYYEKKLIDTTVDAANSAQVTPYPYIRLSEMYLIAAEACIELGQLDEAISFINPLRARINMPDTEATLAVRGQSKTQADMRDLLRRERRSELAYEDSRYFDVRRWMIANVTQSKPVMGMSVWATLKPGKTASAPYVHNEDIWDYHYVVNDLSYRENRKWDNKMYFAPISVNEVNRTDGIIVQNPGH